VCVVARNLNTRHRSEEESDDARHGKASALLAKEGGKMLAQKASEAEQVLTVEC
jgi:hypothetical protein